MKLYITGRLELVMDWDEDLRKSRCLEIIVPDDGEIIIVPPACSYGGSADGIHICIEQPLINLKQTVSALNYWNMPAKEVMLCWELLLVRNVWRQRRTIHEWLIEDCFCNFYCYFLKNIYIIFFFVFFIYLLNFYFLVIMSLYGLY